MIGGKDGFMDLLERSSAELYADHPDLMDTGGLIPTPNEIHEDDVALFDEGRDAGLITGCPRSQPCRSITTCPA